jgi:outer membrane protein insertion porin family
MSREITACERMNANLTYRRITTNIPAEVLVRRDALRGMAANWERDTRNNIFSPSSGSTTRLGIRAYGSVLGGPSYMVFTGWWSRYQLTSPSSVLATRLRVGFAEPYGGTADVPIFDRFFAGGSSSVRGYAERQLGPVTAITDTSGVTTYQPRGGRALLLFSVAYRWPRVVGPIGTLAFMDAGNVWASLGDMGKGLAASVGVGVFLDTPLGPLRLDYGWRLNQSVEEREIPGYRLPPGQFHISVLHAF